MTPSLDNAPFMTVAVLGAWVLIYLGWKLARRLARKLAVRRAKRMDGRISDSWRHIRGFDFRERKERENEERRF